jgi:Domain of unknown function (DUF4296)
MNTKNNFYINLSSFHIKSILKLIPQSKVCENPFYTCHLRAFTFKIILLLGIFLLFSILPGCSNNKVIEESKFVKIYSDLVIAQDTIANNPSILNSVKQKIFKRYGVSDEEYRNTIKYYNRNSEKWKDFFIKVTAHINSMKKGNDR